jgi:hypothetical protein
MPLVVSTKKDEIYDFIPVLFRGDENPFTIQLKKIDSKSFAKLEDGLTKINQDDSTIMFATGSFNWNIVKRGVVGWSNIDDEKGKPVKFIRDTNGLMEDSCIELLPLEVLSEVATAIAAITRNPEHTEILLGITVDGKSK